MSLNMVLVERKAYCCVANAFLSGLELIWLILGVANGPSKTLGLAKF